MNPLQGNAPRLVLLTPADRERIDQAIIEILEQIGMEVLQDRARELLLAHGATEDKTGRILVTEAMVRAAIDSAPKNILVYDRNGDPAMDLGERRSYYGTGSDLWYQIDLQTGEQRPSVLEDAALAARTAQALPNIDFVMTYAHASDLAPERAYLAEVGQLILNSTKPILHIAMDLPDLTAMHQMAVVVRGSEEDAIRRPFMIHYAEPTSPLRHAQDGLNRLLFCADKGLPVVYSPAPLAGSSAPLTTAGHVAQGLAEGLFGLVVHQLQRPGAPFIMGMGPAILDMVTTQSSYNAPEYYLGYLTAVEMTQYYGLPSFGYAGTSDSPIPDGQAAFESGLLSYLSGLIGANLNHDVGYLDFGRTGALEFIVMGDEFISQARRFMAGVPVSDETLALDVIREAAQGGQYLTNRHTLKHCRNQQWRPGLLNRLEYDKWDRAGKLDLRERARIKAREILAAGVDQPLDDRIAARILKIVDEFRP